MNFAITEQTYGNVWRKLAAWEGHSGKLPPDLMGSAKTLAAGADCRRDRIGQMVRETPGITSKKLAQMFSVSSLTIAQDLYRLRCRGEIRTEKRGPNAAHYPVQQ